MMDAAAPQEQEQQLEQEDVLELEEKRIVIVRLHASASVRRSTMLTGAAPRRHRNRRLVPVRRRGPHARQCAAIRHHEEVSLLSAFLTRGGTLTGDHSPQVEFCGYTIPHPSETKMNLRIQTYGESTLLCRVLCKGKQLTDQIRRMRSKPSRRVWIV